MAARDDFGSNAGTPRGYGGGGFSGRAGGLGNGGVGGGMGGGFAGGGAGRNGGINSRTGMGTGKTMFGGMAMGRPGGPALNPGAWGVRPQPQVSQGPMNRPTRPGLLGNPTPAAVAGVNPVPENVLAIEDYPMPPLQDVPWSDPRVPDPRLNNPDAVKFKPHPSFYDYGWKPPVGMTQPSFLDDPKDAANRGPWKGAPQDFYNVGGGQGMTAYNTERNPYAGPRGGGYNPGSRGPGTGGW